ncbi:MAG: hypothetical protein ACJA1H_001362 [Glaciecola sp.]|jgi:hypothetical protein
MKNKYLIILISIVLFSCGNERILQLPEIENAKITEIRDVSPAYLFYDETKEDSIELNRKNLIITANWLVNVDKRLTLAQAIPKIKFLQEKKRNAELHKNEDAKNYFTCNDTSIKNLGFLEFTDVFYHEDRSTSPSSPLMLISNMMADNEMTEHPEIRSNNEVHIIRYDGENKLKNKVLKYSEFSDYLNSTLKNSNKDSLVVFLNFEKNLSFQDYINFKSTIKDINIEGVRIGRTEFIY